MAVLILWKFSGDDSFYKKIYVRSRTLEAKLNDGPSSNDDILRIRLIETPAQKQEIVQRGKTGL
jgi:hypothetical protein